MDVFRVFDALNYLPNLQLGIDAAGQAGGVVEGAICYSGDLSNPQETKYTIDYYMDLVAELVKGGIHFLCIKDMAGLLKPAAANILVGSIRAQYPKLPIHIHTHDTSGAGVASMLACAEAGADIIDCAVDSMSGMTSQPSMGAIVASLQNTDLDTEMLQTDINKYNTYWEQTRRLYAPFECTTTMKSGNSDVYLNEIPGGQYTNLQFQAFSLGLSDQFHEVKQKYCEANELLGNIVKVTPTSKIVGDLAQFMTQNKLTKDDVLAKADELDFPTSVVEFFRGEIGQPYGGFPEPLRTKVMKGEPSLTERAGKSLPPINFEALREELVKEYGHDVTDCDVMSYCMYPDVFLEYASFREEFGPVEGLPTRLFFTGSEIGEEFEVEIETGKVLNLKIIAVSDVYPDGNREVFCEVNGQMRTFFIEDKNEVKNIVRNPKAEKGVKGSLGAPMPGKVVSLRVKEGDVVEKGDSVVVLTAMKMETNVSAPISGTIASIAVSQDMHVDAADLLLTITPN